jgi:hypothetical protein
MAVAVAQEPGQATPTPLRNPATRAEADVGNSSIQLLGQSQKFLRLPAAVTKGVERIHSKADYSPNQ